MKSNQDHQTHTSSTGDVDLALVTRLYKASRRQQHFSETDYSETTNPLERSFVRLFKRHLAEHVEGWSLLGNSESGTAERSSSMMIEIESNHTVVERPMPDQRRKRWETESCTPGRVTRASAVRCKGAVRTSEAMRGTCRRRSSMDCR